MSDASLPDVLAEQIKADRYERDQFRTELMKTIARIETQTSKTNGRVTALEQWRMFLLGGFAVCVAPWAINLIKLLNP